MRKKIAIVCLVLVILGLVAGPALAKIVFRHDFDHRLLLFEYPKWEGDDAVSQGFDTWRSIEGTRVFSRKLYCSGIYSPSVRLFARNDGGIDITGSCAWLTETPCPTMPHYPTSTP